MIKCSKLYFPKIHTFNNIYYEPNDVPDIVLVLGLYSSRENKVSTFMELMFKWEKQPKQEYLMCLVVQIATKKASSVVGDGEWVIRQGLSDFVVVQSFSHAQLFLTPWTAVRQASLSFTIFWNLLKLVSFESVIPPTILSSVVPFSFCLQSFPASGSFLMSCLFVSGGQTIWASLSASVLPMNIQDWFPLGLTGLISLQSKGLSRVFSNTTVQKHQFFGTQLS